MDDSSKQLLHIQRILNTLNYQIDLSLRGESTVLNNFLKELNFEHSNTNNILIKVSTNGFNLYNNLSDPIFEFKIASVNDPLDIFVKNINKINEDKIKYIQLSIKGGSK